VKKAAREVTAEMEKGWEKVKALATKGVDELIKLFATLKGVFDQLKSMLPELQDLVTCVETIKKDAEAIYGILKGIYSRIQTIVETDGVGFGKIFLDLVCNFDIFRQAVEALVGGIKQKDVLKKFNLIGQFVGLLLKAIGSRRFKMMKLFNR